MFTLLLGSLLATSSTGSSTLERQYLPTAICADGTPGVYYIAANSSSSDYLVYLKGGGGCAHDQSLCETIEDARLLSSEGLTDTMEGYGLLSGDVEENPLYSTFNRVFINYCTQDLYLLDTESSDGKFQFRGRPLIEETMALLFGSLEQEASVILVGSSAGGVGAFNVVSWMLDSFDRVTETSVIIDSAVFVNAEGFMEGALGFMTDNPSVAYSPSCSDEYNGGPCCVQFSCMVLTEQYPIDRLNGTFIIQTAQDLSPFSRLFRFGDVDSYSGFDNLWDFASYTGTLASELHMLADLFPSRLSLFVPSCIDHTILLVGGESMFLVCQGGGELPGFAGDLDVEAACVYDESGRSSGVTYGIVLFENNGLAVTTEVSVDAWNSVQIEGTSVRTAMGIWWEGRDESGDQFALFDGCNDVNCNPTCLSGITLDKREQSDSVLVWAIVVTFVASAAIVIGAYIFFVIWGLRWASRAARGVSFLLGEERVVTQHHARRHHTSAYNAVVPVLEWRSLSYWLPNDKKQLLRGVDGNIPEGALCALIGPTGSGKSTLLDLLTGRREFGRCSGKFLFYGNSITDQRVKEEYLSQSGYMRQLQTGFLDGLSAIDNLVFAVMMRFPGDVEEQTRRVQRAIELTKLGESIHTKAADLSGGLKRRLSLALELLAHRRVLFLDEPTSGLDASGSLDIMTVLKRLSSNMTIVVSIHQPRPEIWILFSHSLILNFGRIVFSGPANEALEVVSQHLPPSGGSCDNVRGTSRSDSTIVKGFENASVPDMIMDTLMVLDEDSLCHVVDTKERNSHSLALNVPGVKSSSSAWKIAAMLMARRWKSGYSKRLVFGFSVLVVPTLFIGLTLRYANEQPIGGLLITSVLAAGALPVNLIYSSVLVKSMEETWKLIRVELQDEFYRPTCAILSIVVENIGVCILASLVVAIAMFITFWDMYVGGLVIVQAFCAYFLLSCICIGTMISLAISGLEITRVYTLIRVMNSVWFFFSGTFLTVSSLPASLKLVTYTSPVFWSSSFILRVILDGLDMSSSCSYTTSVAYCTDQYGDVVANKIDLHQRPTVYNLVAISVFAVGGMLLLIAAIKSKSQKVDIFDGLGGEKKRTNRKLTRRRVNVAAIGPTAVVTGKVGPGR